jgi:hypothetical protein
MNDWIKVALIIVVAIAVAWGIYACSGPARFGVPIPR